MKLKVPFFLLIAMFSLTISAQQITQSFAKKTPPTEEQLKRWSHLDLMRDTIPGMSIDKAYAELLKHKKGVRVIVGVIDSGVDINHEDLNRRRSWLEFFR
jgi:cell wall-associated protease